MMLQGRKKKKKKRKEVLKEEEESNWLKQNWKILLILFVIAPLMTLFWYILINQL